MAVQQMQVVVQKCPSVETIFCSDAPLDAFNEPGKAGCRTRPHLPAGSEIRERHQPHRGEPIAANLPYPSGANSVLLRGRAERISATRLQWKRVIDGPD